MIIIIHSYNKKCYPLPGYLLQKNITKILLPECRDFLFKIPSEHKIILSQDRSVANCLFHSLLLFQADFSSTLLFSSHRNATSMIKNEDIWFWQHSNKRRKFGACAVFIKVFSDAILTACFRYAEWNSWWTSIKNASQLMLFFTVRPMDIDVQELISIFHYSVLGYIKVKVATFCQPQFIWILVSKTRNTLHLVERPMCTEPN